MSLGMSQVPMINGTPMTLDEQIRLDMMTEGHITKPTYARFVRETFDGMVSLIERKNRDYCGAGNDPFANFRQAERVGVDTYKGLCVRFLDKVARIESFAQNGQLESEALEDAWLDCIGYACLALGMLKEKEFKR